MYLSVVHSFPAAEPTVPAAVPTAVLAAEAAAEAAAKWLTLSHGSLFILLPHLF